MSKTKAQKNIERLEKQGYDSVAKAVYEAFRRGVNHRATLRLDELIEECDKRGTSTYTDTQKDSIENDEQTPPVFFPITAKLNQTALIRMKDAYMDTADSPWYLEPTPVVSLPDRLQSRLDSAIRQQAIDVINARADGKRIDENVERSVIAQLRNTAWDKGYTMAEEALKGMKRLIEDVMVESRWRDVLDSYLDNFISHPFAILKGPLYRPRKAYFWNGSKLDTRDEDQYFAENVNPYDLIWSPEAKDLQSCEFVIHRQTMSTSDLLELRDLDNSVIGDSVELAVMSDEPDQIEVSDMLKAKHEGTDFSHRPHFVLEYHGRLTGQQLLSFATPEEQEKLKLRDHEDPDAKVKTARFGVVHLFKTYEIEALVCRGYTLRIRMKEDLRKRRPFHMASSYPETGRMVGSCLALRVADVQDAANMTFRAGVLNTLFSMGPVIEVEAERFAGSEIPEEIGPFSTHAVSRSAVASNNSKNAINYTNFPNQTAAMLSALGFYIDQAQSVTGIPPIMQGEEQNPSRTLGAQALRHTSALKIIKSMISIIDHKIIEPFVEDLYYLMLQYHDDDSIKADCKVRVRGSQGLIAQEQREARPIETMQAVTPLLGALSPEKQEAIAEQLAVESLSQKGYDVQALGLSKNSAAQTEVAARGAPSPIDSLGGNSSAAVAAEASGKI